jgi:ABC-type multidrug transport system permease subunit
VGAKFVESLPCPSARGTVGLLILGALSSPLLDLTFSILILVLSISSSGISLGSFAFLSLACGTDLANIVVLLMGQSRALPMPQEIDPSIF